MTKNTLRKIKNLLYRRFVTVDEITPQCQMSLFVMPILLPKFGSRATEFISEAIEFLNFIVCREL